MTTAPERWGSLLDVPGLLVGQSERIGGGWLTGVTVVVPPPGTVGGVDVRGGGPGTHETDALDPTTLVPTVDAVVLTGSSAYGLVAASGAQGVLERHGRGFPVGTRPDGRPLVVPIVPAAAVFDLGRGGDPDARVDAALGAAATQAALAGQSPVRRGSVGAGTGALCAAGRIKGGVGTAALRLPGLGRDGETVTVGALAVVNAVGSPADPRTGLLYATGFLPAEAFRPLLPSPADAARWREQVTPAPGTTSAPFSVPGTTAAGTATTLAVVATDAVLDPAQARRTATAAHAGLARSLDPVHTLLDGDTVFALATGPVVLAPQSLVALQAAAATAVAAAVLDAVLAAGGPTRAVLDVPAYLDLCPSALLPEDPRP